jgi:hypothetical protein
MMPVTIARENLPEEPPRYVALLDHGTIRAEGKTAGEALDALTAQLPEEERDFVFVVQQQTRPDAFFTAEQIARLRELMDKANRTGLSEAESQERLALIDAEIRASGQRAAAIFSSLRK